MRWRLFICGIAALLLAAAPASAQGRYLHRHGAIPLDRILPHIRSEHPGSLSDADGPFADPAGRLHYRIKWLTPDGRVIWLDADARTGRILGVNRGWDGYGRYPRARGHAGPPARFRGGPAPRYFRPRAHSGWRGGHGRFGLESRHGGRGHGHRGR